MKTLLKNQEAWENPASKVLVKVESLVDIVPALEHYPVVLHNTNPSLGNLEQVAKIFGGAQKNPTFAEIRDIMPLSSSKNNSIALSKGFHPPHTDGSFSQQLLTVFMLQCVFPDEMGGGQGLFWGIDKMLQQMPPEIREFLKEVPVRYKRVREDGISHDEFIGTILFEYEGKISIRWRYDTQVRPQLLSNATKAERERFESYMAWILTYLATEAPVEVTYQPGDIAIVNNLRAFHARRILKGNNRHFRRAWLKLV